MIMKRTMYQTISEWNVRWRHAREFGNGIENPVISMTGGPEKLVNRT
jgi:hypothetical protein